ncbi:MAG: patatin-like phospholipase family protein [Proteobacteria bacterium]|nr:patatin-like phospholipase family protein [Pseudomonadota bacterium]MBU1585097.1 patatin-like phospholipase family protein [Pseudomonadota bacterium]MBU2628818.1 patatin-like phospholipase family protein [Pseudomonadota bacterium]
METTSLFSQCIGVFEGGGVRGSAFAGAITEARNAGINFVGSVGTSSGSIAAVLLAAGLSNDDIEKVLSSNFEEFQQPPEKKFGNTSKVSKIFQKCIPGTIGEKIRQINNIGRYSSKGIETWLNDILKKHLNIDKGLVLFKDLPNPVSVIATDLVQGTYKIWDTYSTPTSPVSFAVRASCSIPFYFEPVIGEGTMFVDGGLIANLPIFLAKSLAFRTEFPLLCFRMIRNNQDTRNPFENYMDFGIAIIDAMLDGTSEIQLSLTDKRQIIDIETGSIRATNFSLTDEDKEFLKNNGKKAVKQFLHDEQRRVASATPMKPQPAGFREGLLEETINIIDQANSEICIIAGDLSWLRELHVSLMNAKLKDVRIRLICEKHNSEAYTSAVKGALAIGSEVLEVDQVNIKGTIIDPQSSLTKMILIEDYPTIHGRIYFGPEDRGLASLVQEYFEKQWKAGNVILNKKSPTIIGIDETELITALKKGVPQYKELKILIDTVNINKTKPMTKFLESFKLKRLKHLEYIRSRSGIGMAGLIKGSTWAITPPIIEKLKNDDLIIIDGTHRIFSALQNGIHDMRVIIVENPFSNLPAAPMNDWGNIIIIKRKLPRIERYANYHESNFRQIRKAYEEYLA